MKDIIKSQLYQLRKWAFIWTVLIVIFVIDIGMSTWFGYIFIDARYTFISASEIFANFGMITITMAVAFIGIAVPSVCCTDMKDKTANNELLSGHTRCDVYFARAITSVIVGLTGWVVIAALPVVINTVLFGWGNAVPLKDVISIYVLSLVPYIRTILELVFASFIIRNANYVMAISFLLSTVANVMAGFTHDSIYFFGMFNLMKLFTVNSTAMYGLNPDGGMYNVYDASMSSETVIMTVVVSVIIGAGALIAGYYFYKKDDIN